MEKSFKLKFDMKKKQFIHFCGVIISFLLFASNISIAQQNIEINGYLQNFQTVWKQRYNNKLQLSNTITNRINFDFYPIDGFTINAGMRNIIEYGDFVNSIPGYVQILTKDEGYFNLTSNISSGSSYVFYIKFDRLNILYSKGNYEVQLGRQRINLGINMVWTPNDILNSSSFLNFDYVEKAGSDAFRFQYYTGISSSIEFVYKLNRSKEVSAAGIFKFNEWKYDFQILIGQMEDDYILGGGWAGQIGNAGFTGEMTYFRNKDSFNDTAGIFVAAIGGSYTFSNSLSIRGEFLYNGNGKTESAGLFNNPFSQKYSAKNLSLAKYSLFGELSYPITPLIIADISSIINPNDKSFYIGPSVNVSLTEDIYLLAAAQFFSGKQFSEWGDYGQFYFLRLKWNF